ncbi:MAG: glycosyltransferase family 4 protein [Candidatus Omnitrophica bacterium]|nr:glycosyltransferase family 4 protein [Candidatus Omnitrophota bacterium]
MNVLILTTHLNIGGVGMYTVNLAKYLKKLGVTPLVVSSGGSLVETLSTEGIRHEKLNIDTKCEIGPKVLAAFPLLSNLVRNNNIEVVHAQTRVAQVLAALTKYFSGVPYVTTCHGFFNYNNFGRKLVPAWGDRVIAISRGVEEHLMHDFKVPAEKVRQIYNGIEVDRFKTAGKCPEFLKELGIAGNEIPIGTVGRFSSVKGHEYLIRAFKKVIAAGHNAKLLFLGDDNAEKQKAVDLIRELGIEDKVVIRLGRETALEKVLSAIDIFALPSLQEGLGLSLMEAMAAGCASVASDVGGIKELIVDGVDGILVESANSDKLADALITLINDPELRKKLGGNARRKALEKFRIEDSVSKTLEVYNEVVK